MNAIRCPQCKSVNQLSATQCFECQMPFGNLLQSAYISVPVEQTFEAQAFSNAQYQQTMSAYQPIPQDNELGRKTFFWYRIYLAVMVFFSAVSIAIGAFLITTPVDTNMYTPQELLIMGYAYVIFGAIFGLVFLVALLLPRKPFNWIVGFVMMAFGLTSCLTLPGVVVLFIFWLKPETQAYFGRK